MSTNHTMKVLSDLLAGAADPQAGVQLRVGTITSVAGNKQTATVDLGQGDLTAVLPHGYTPTVGDTVRLLVQGPQVIVLSPSVGSTAVEQGTAPAATSGAPALYIGATLPTPHAPRYLWVKFFMDPVSGLPQVDLIVEDGT